MEITCSQCNSKLNVPDDRIPKDQAVKINCPKCKNRITLDLRTPPEENLSLDVSLTDSGNLELKPVEQKQEKSSEDYSYDDYSGDQALDFFDEGVKIALVIVKGDDKREKVGSALEGLGFQCIYADSTRDALGKLRYHLFNFVLLADNFDSQDILYSPIMNYLNRLPMSSRRKIYVALIGDRFKTMDEMMAFALSANAVVSSKDIDRLASIFKKGIADNEKFYKVLMDTLAEFGKD
jgi:DNA-directed RNA polymerase subunit RPC12/RpoP